LAAEQQEVPDNIATAITEISEYATLLIRDEIELARAEITAKLRKLAMGAAVGVAAGAFVVFAVSLFLNGLAWLFAYELFPPGQVFWGFFVVTGMLLVLAAAGGMIARRALQQGAPPAPTMAIDEARKIAEMVQEETTV
jgi:hypothetical protein